MPVGTVGRRLLTVAAVAIATIRALTRDGGVGGMIRYSTQSCSRTKFRPEEVSSYILLGSST